MRFRLSFALLGGLLAGALGCQPASSGAPGPKPCFVEEPCETNTSEMCQLPCKDSPGGGVGHGGSGGDTSAGGGGTGGSGGSGGKSVDVSGNVVRFTTATFDATVPHTNLTTVSAVDVNGDMITVDTNNGAFEMKSVAKGDQWVLVTDTSGGAAGIFSTYSAQPMDGMSLLEVPVIPITALDDVAIQVDVPTFTPGAAQMVILFLDDASGQPVEGVTIGALAGAKYGFDIGGQGAYTTNPQQTGPLGTAVLFNVIVPAVSTIQLKYSFNGNPQATIELPAAPDTATYAVLPVNTQ